MNKTSSYREGKENLMNYYQFKVLDIEFLNLRIKNLLHSDFIKLQ